VEYGVEGVEADFFDVDKFEVEDQLVLVEGGIILKLLQLAVDQILARIHLLNDLFPLSLRRRCIIPQKL